MKTGHEQTIPFRKHTTEDENTFAILNVYTSSSFVNTWIDTQIEMYCIQGIAFAQSDSDSICPDVASPFVGYFPHAHP